VLVEVAQDRLPVVNRRAVLEDEERDLVVAAGLAAHLVAVLLVGRDLLRDEVDAELGQPLTHAVRVRAPLGLVEREHGRLVDARAHRYTSAAPDDPVAPDDRAEL
jgi:hypothetical protein